MITEQDCIKASEDAKLWIQKHIIDALRANHDAALEEFDKLRNEEFIKRLGFFLCAFAAKTGETNQDWMGIVHKVVQYHLLTIEYDRTL